MNSLIFKESRLSLSAPGDLLLRLVARSWYVLLGVATPLFIASDIPRLRWIGIFIALFLIDRLIHLGEGEFSLAELGGAHNNIAQALTANAYRSLNYAYRKALISGESFHLLLLKELTARREMKEVFERLDVSYNEFYQKLESYLEQPPQKNNREALLALIEEIARVAYENAKNTGEKFIEARNVFIGLAMLGDNTLTRLFQLFDIQPADLGNAIIFARYRGIFSRLKSLPSVLGGFIKQSRFLRHRVMNRAWTARPTPTLDTYGTDLTDLARGERVGFLVGHEKEFNTMLDIISRPGKPNALLVGDPGTGRTSIVAHLAFRMVHDQVSQVLFDKRLISLAVGDLIANATPEELAGRIKKIVEEILNAGNIVLAIPNIHDLFRTAQNTSINAIDLLLPVIKNEAIPVIGDTYSREFKEYIERNSDFLDQFEVVRVEELNEEEAIRFLIYNALILEKEFGIYVTFRAIAKSVELAHRYLRNKPLPGSAVDILKQALARARENRLKILREGEVIRVAESQTKIPIQKAGIAETDKLLHLEDIIHERLINQESAVKAVAQALREYRSGLARQGGPIATFLFVGPTGVGKTELAKRLAEIQFGSETLMKRFDMSEYQDRQSVARFIGSSDGQRSGELTEAILQNPYCLILLDEFEKASPDILNLFLQVFDDGRLTDNLGRIVSFENTIIIATSNAHSELIKEWLKAGHGMEEMGEMLKDKLTDYFKPELLNRFSSVIVFRSLELSEIYEVTKLLVGEVGRTLKSTQGIDLVVEDSAVQHIAETGFSPTFGARPLRQVISEEIRSVLAEKILKKEIARGNTILISYNGKTLIFKVSE